MDSIVNKLTEIEDAASAIVAHAETQKEVLDREYDEKRRAFDEDLEKQTAYKQEYFKNMSSKLSAKESDLQLNSRFYSVLYKAIQYVAESEGYSLVLKTSDADLVWYHTEIDITDKVIARVRASN